MSNTTKTKKTTRKTKTTKTKEQEVKKFSTKKKVILTGSLLTPVIIGVIAGVTYVSVNNTKSWTFVNSDYVNLRNSIINDIKQRNMKYSDFKTHLVHYFKTYLNASGYSITKLITNVEVLEHLTGSEIIKVTLNSNNNSFNGFTKQQNPKFYLTNNELFIEFSGDTSITFPNQ